jgi:hypothetical protein
MCRASLLAAASFLLLLAAAPSAFAQIHTDADFVSHYYGVSGQTHTIVSNPSIGTTPVLQLKNAPSRYEYTIFNLSSNNCYLSPLSSVSSTNGDYIGANGGYVNINVLDDLTHPADEEWIVCAGASSSLHIEEQYFD